MHQQDRRVRKTRQALSDALIALILEKGYEVITIKDITDRADVAHATFYRHYRDKDDLLTRKLEEIVSEIEAMTREPTLKGSEGYLIFKHAQENSTLYQILLSSAGTLQVRKWLKERMVANTLKTCRPLSAYPASTISPEIAANHIIGSLLHLIEWWLDHKMPYTPHQMAQIYEQLISNATLLALQLQTAPSQHHSIEGQPEFRHAGEDQETEAATDPRISKDVG